MLLTAKLSCGISLGLFRRWIDHHAKQRNGGSIAVLQTAWFRGPYSASRVCFSAGGTIGTRQTEVNLKLVTYKNLVVQR
jgi:hypothetical protein